MNKPSTHRYHPGSMKPNPFVYTFRNNTRLTAPPTRTITPHTRSLSFGGFGAFRASCTVFCFDVFFFLGVSQTNSIGSLYRSSSLISDEDTVDCLAVVGDVGGVVVGVPQVVQNFTSVPSSLPHCLQKGKVEPLVTSLTMLLG